MHDVYNIVGACACVLRARKKKTQASSATILGHRLINMSLDRLCLGEQTDYRYLSNAISPPADDAADFAKTNVRLAHSRFLFYFTRYVAFFVAHTRPRFSPALVPRVSLPLSLFLFFFSLSPSSLSPSLSQITISSCGSHTSH